MIQPNDQRIDLTEAIDLILDFNETIQVGLVWKYKSQRIKKWAIDSNWWKQSKLLSTLCYQKKLFFSLVCIKYI